MRESVCLVRSFSQPAEISSRETNEAVPHRVLTESVSFGRFASESLQWEKWSSFTQNRYLEEVQRFTKPGSVAEKKAFFEAHFKNRASGRTAKTKMEEVNVKTSDETVCEIRKDNLVDSEVPLVVNNGMAMNEEVRHEDVSNAEVDSVVPSVSVMDETTVVQTGEVKVINAESFESMAVPEDEALDQDNSTSLSNERRPSSSDSKTCSISSHLEPSFVIGLDLPLKKTRKEPPSSKKRSISVSKNQNRSPPESFHIPIKCAPPANTEKTRKEPPSSRKRSISVSKNQNRPPPEPFHLSVNCAPSRSSTNAKEAGKAVRKERSGPSSVHMSLNLASSARQTNKTAPKDMARKPTLHETNSSNARNSVNSKGNEPTVASKSRKRPLPRTAKEDSNAPKCSTRASAFRLPELAPLNIQPSVNKRKNITVGSSVSCRIPNNVQRQPSAGCENLSTHSRTRAKSFTVTSPFNFRSDERAEKRKQFFKKLEEKNKKEEPGKDKLSCGGLKEMFIDGV
ncbi:protein WVD2-like 7 [Eutrema salsugineum]|uniref:protein WVD2-like 7 n=1 Tax=Eutrema salsugineum TaxID=72664 RepID=UPI000CED65A0|nr:protein WVD2-like 7 [Eutrema salsugineum]